MQSAEQENSHKESRESQSKPSNSDKCLALVLSGGASKGAYQAGALQGLIYGDSN